MQAAATYLTSNRVVNAISAFHDRVNGMLASGRAVNGSAFDAATVAKLSANLDITFKEYVAFQNAKSAAHASGRISYDEAQTIYCLLGSGPEDFNSQGLAEKTIVTKLISELLCR